MQCNPFSQSIVRHDIGRAFRESTISLDVVDGETIPCITDAYSVAAALEQTELMAMKLLESKLPIFVLTATANGIRVHSSPIAIPLISLLKTDSSTIRAHFPAYVFHPYIEVFMRLAQQHDLYYWAAIYDSLSKDELIDVAVRFNDMVNGLSYECGSATFKRRMKGHRALVRKNEKSVRLYIDALFEVYARLLVIRIDLGYLKYAGAARDWKQAKEHREQLIVFINRDLPRLLLSKSDVALGVASTALPGYVICTEHGGDKGWHFHLMLLLNGEKSCHSINIAGMVGKHWDEKIAPGMELHRNCNYYASDYKRLGIGEVHWSDTAKREVLHKAAAYFCKEDYYGRGLIEGKDRSLSKGRMPEPKEKSGRPRSDRAATPDVAAAPSSPQIGPVAVPLRSPILESEVPF